MLTFDSALTTTLSASGSKIAWSNALKTALGTNRIISCYRDNDPSASDPYVTGTLFFQATNTGALSVRSGNVSGLGSISDVTIQLATSIGTGKSILRIEGNGHWVQGTLGLNNTNSDFIINGEFTSSVGIGMDVSGGVGLKAPAAIPSGTGPSAPPKSIDTPVYVTIENHTNAVNPTLIGTILFNKRVEDMVFQDPELSNNIGDVRITQSTDSVIYDGFEFGATLYALNPVVNGEVNDTVYQCQIACKPHGRWANYPTLDTYNSETDTTFPSPFKAKLHRADGSVIHTFQMRDGLAINSPSYIMARTFEQPLRPMFNCSMLLAWTSHKPTVNTNATTYHPGLTEESVRPSQNKTRVATVPMLPIYDPQFQQNGVNHWFALPRWPMRKDANPTGAYNGSPELLAEDPNSDPYLYNVGRSFDTTARVSGWDYEPGSVSGHDWYCGPGGPRFDRNVFPTVLALHMTDLDGRRLKGNESYRDMSHAWGMGYFNHSQHHFTNVKNMTTLPEDAISAGEYSHSQTYYGPNDAGYVPGGLAKHVPLFARSTALFDKDGRYKWCSYAPDNLHNYHQPGLWTMFYNSPMHVISAKMHYFHNIMSAQLYTKPGAGAHNWGFNRGMAWRFMHYVVMWKIATEHPLGMSRDKIEDRFKADLEGFYDVHYVPTKITNDPSVYYEGIRNLGIPVTIYNYTVNGARMVNYSVLSNSLAYYIGNVYLLMKQTGMWDTMLAKSTKCKLAFEFMMECMDKYSVDFILDTSGHGEGYGPTWYNENKGSAWYTSLTDLHPEGTLNISHLPKSWAEWETILPPRGQEDWITAEDGTSRERDATHHMRAQWAHMRRDYFPEYPYPRLEQACAKYDQYYDTWAQRVASYSTKEAQGQFDWAKRHPGQAIYKAPTP